MVEQIHDIIRQDLIKNQNDLLNMRHYYTHKFRSNNRFIDINVGIFIDEKQRQVAQIDVADKNNKIRERLIIENNTIVDTDIIYKRYE